MSSQCRAGGSPPRTGAVLHAACSAGVGDDALSAARAAVVDVSAGMGGAPVDLAVVFVGGAYTDDVDLVLGHVRDELEPRHVLAVTAEGVISGSAEVEHSRALSLWAASLPGVHLQPLRYEPPLKGQREAQREGWGERAAGWQLPTEDAAAVVLLTDPFTFPADAFLAWLHQGRPGLPVSGGQASGAQLPGGNRLHVDGATYTDGAVGVAIGGEVSVRTLVSQGCRPVGASYVVTAGEDNIIRALGGAPPVQRLRETYAGANPVDRGLMRSGLQIGTVIDEYRVDFGRGDFLVRAVLGADEATGAIAIGDRVEVGRTVQFHVRDAASAAEDLTELLGAFGEIQQPAAGLLFTCNGRGARLFGTPDHDATTVRGALGELPLAGFFCAGELGPVGDRSFVHGYTASLLVLESPRA